MATELKTPIAGQIKDEEFKVAESGTEASGARASSTAKLGGTIGRKLMMLVMLTAFAALSITAVAMVVYDAITYQRGWIDDLVTQADLLGRASAPALQFADPEAAHGNLEMVRVRPAIIAAALYSPDGKLFASYRQTPDAALPTAPEDEGHHIDGERIELYRRIVENGDWIGTVYLRARYQLADRMRGYLLILGGVLVASLAIATVISLGLQRALIRPIEAVTEVANQIMQRRDFSLRAPRTSDDEIGVLVDAFNDMLHEVSQSTKALENSNLALQREMGERRGAEEALRLADKRKDEFLATLAHELRNPLAPIRNALYILRAQRGPKLPESSEQAQQMIERQVNQMIRLVDDLLDVSRITTGKLSLKREPTDLASIIHSAVETARPLIHARHQQLAVEIPPDEVKLSADATRLSQVFSNLLNNASKYTEPGGHIRVSAQVERDTVTVSVADDGRGLAPEMLPAIFNMFTQVDSSFDSTRGGLGVGLALSRRLIELHGGRINARSAGLGQGSEFIVTLPRGDCSDSAGGGGVAAADPQAAPARVLLTDDNTDFAGSLAQILRLKGHDVRVAADGESALRLLENFHPQFGFLDIGLPGMDGYELARRIRLLPQARGCVLVAVTGWGQERDRARARAAGFDHHMVKPVDLGRVEQILRGGPAG